MTGFPKKSVIELIIFDLDGTLVDAYRAVWQSINYTLKRLGLPSRSHALIRRRVGWGDRHLIAALVSSDKVDRALLIYRRHHQTALKLGTKFLPGAFKTLKKLKAEGRLLAIASNRPALFTRAILKILKIDSYFDYVLCADQVRRPKPSPDILQKILKKFSLTPSAALYVGDMTIDAQAGQGAGVKTIIVTTGSSTCEEIVFLKPFAVIERLDQLKGAMSSL